MKNEKYNILTIVNTYINSLWYWFIINNIWVYFVDRKIFQSWARVFFVNKFNICSQKEKLSFHDQFIDITTEFPKFFQVSYKLALTWILTISGSLSGSLLAGLTTIMLWAVDTGRCFNLMGLRDVVEDIELDRTFLEPEWLLLRIFGESIQNGK